MQLALNPLSHIVPPSNGPRKHVGLPKEQKNVLKTSYAMTYHSWSLPQQPSIRTVSGTVAKILEEIVVANNVGTVLNSPFNAPKVPSISIQNYLERFVKFARCSMETFILALILIDRLIQNTTNLKIHATNVHRLFLTGMTLAIKLQDDLHLSNEDIAKVGGIQADQLAELEIHMLQGIQFWVTVPQEQFANYLDYLLCKEIIN